MGRYPWAVRAGGPLLGGAGTPPAVFSWRPSTNPGVLPSSTFARTGVAQVLTTTNGVDYWLQTVFTGEPRFKNLRRDYNDIPDTLYDTFVTWNADGNAVLGVDTIDFTATGDAATSGGFGLTDGSSNLGYDLWFVFTATGNGTVTIGCGDGILGDFTSQQITLTATPTRFACLTTFNTSTRSDGQVRFRRGVGDTITQLTRISGIMVQRAASGVTGPPDDVDPSVVYNALVLGVQISATSNANVLEADGTVTVNPGVPLQNGGFLRERLGQNRCRQSGDLTVSPWTARGVVVPSGLGANGIGTPATRLTGLGDANVDDIFQLISVSVTSSPIAPAFGIKRVSTTGILRVANPQGGSNGIWEIDLDALGPRWEVIRPGSRYVKVIEPFVSTAGNQAGLQFYAESGGPLTVDVAALNLFDDAVGSSPISTTTAVGIRNQESLTDVEWPTEASAFVDATMNPTVESMDMLGFGSNAAHRFSNVDSDNVIVQNGGFVLNLVGRHSYLDQRHKFAFSIKTSEGSLVDDMQRTKEITSGIPTFGTIHVGSTSDPTDGDPCLLHEVIVYDGTQSTSQLENLTGTFPDGPFSVFLIAGQSNTHFGFELQPEDAEIRTDILQLGQLSLEDGILIDAFEPLQNTTRGAAIMGFPYAFAKTYKLANPNERVMLVPSAVATTGFSTNNWNQGDPEYNTAVSRTNQIMNDYPGSVFKGVLWHQGESDVGLSEAAYANALDAMIAAMRSDIVGAAGSVFMVGGLPPAWIATDPVPRQLIQDAILDTPNRVSSCSYSDNTGLTVYDGIHYDRASQLTFADRYYAEFLTL